MRTISLQSGQTVAAGNLGEMSEKTLTDMDYVIAISKEQRISCEALGFRFADRSMYTALRISDFRWEMPHGGKFTFTLSEDWRIEEIFRVASEHFGSDCRFALDCAKSDQNLKNELLCRYIGDLKQRGMTASLCWREKTLTGFTLWSVESGAARIYLGAVVKRYQHTGIALYLYGYTIQCMKKQGAWDLKDHIFTSNNASLNLHSMMGRYGGGSLNSKALKVGTSKRI